MMRKKKNNIIKIGNIIKNISFVDACNCAICNGLIGIVINKIDNELFIFSDNKVIEITYDKEDFVILK